MENQHPPGNPGKDAATPNGGDKGARKSKQAPRKRVSQACDRCRSRKDKCDGAKPACSTCATHGRPCSYDTNVKKRGLPEGYVRGLEKLWGLAIRDVGGIEDNLLLAIVGEDGGDALAAWNDEGRSETLVEVWRRSQILRELERLLSNPEESLKRKRTDSESHAGRRASVPLIYGDGQASGGGIAETGWLDGKLDPRLSDGAQELPHFPTIYDSNNLFEAGEEAMLNPPFQQASSNKYAALNIDSPDLPSETWNLIDVYFSYTHSWLPILEKHDLLRTSYQYSQNRANVSISSTGSGSYAVLWAVIAYAKYQHRTINRIPHAQGAVAEAIWTAERLYAYARCLIPNEEGVFELGHVQALLILALANIGTGYLSRAWLLIGQAVRVAIDLGLGRPSDDILQALKAKSRAKHVFLGCFILDTIIAARLGHRPHLRAEDVERVGLVEEDGLEEWDPWTDCLTVRRGDSASRAPASILSTFNRLVEVTQLLNEAACEPDVSERTQPNTRLLGKVHAWSRNQSSPLYFNSASAQSEKAKLLLPHHYNLHITYFNTLAASQSLARGRDRDRPSIEPSIGSARQIGELLIQLSTNFGLLIVPPTFEYFLKSAFDIASEVRGTIDSAHVMLNDWKHTLDNCLDMMEPAWPIFESFKASMLRQTPPSGRRQSQVAFELISGRDNPTDTPTTLASFDASNSHASGTRTVPPSNASLQTGAMAFPALHRDQSFGQSSGRTFKQPSLQTSFNVGNPMSADQQQATSNQASGISNNSPDLGSLPPHLRRPGSITSEIELDPMFQEFAALDATKWAGNWDQSLVNLGFTDPESMKQDFYTMSREPDPLFPNNVFQQLMASTSTEGAGFSALGGAGQLGLVDESEGIEASQILQSLRSAQDHRPSGRGNG